MEPLGRMESGITGTAGCSQQRWWCRTLNRCPPPFSSPRPGVHDNNDDNNDNKSSQEHYQAKRQRLLRSISKMMVIISVRRPHNHSQGDVYHSSVMPLQKSRIMWENGLYESKWDHTPRHPHLQPLFSSLTATTGSKCKDSTEGVYQGLQLRQTGNSCWQKTNPAERQTPDTCAAIKICSTQTHTFTQHKRHTWSRTDDIINTVPGVYCIPAGRVRGESDRGEEEEEQKEEGEEGAGSYQTWELVWGEEEKAQPTW